MDFCGTKCKSTTTGYKKNYTSLCEVFRKNGADYFLLLFHFSLKKKIIKKSWPELQIHAASMTVISGDYRVKDVLCLGAHFERCLQRIISSDQKWYKNIVVGLCEKWTIYFINASGGEAKTKQTKHALSTQSTNYKEKNMTDRNVFCIQCLVILGNTA